MQYVVTQLQLTFLLFFVFRSRIRRQHRYKGGSVAEVAQYRVVSMLDSGAAGPRLKSQSRHCRVTVLGKLFTPIVPLFTKQQNW